MLEHHNRVPLGKALARICRHMIRNRTSAGTPQTASARVVSSPLKRALDCVLAGTGLLCLLPVCFFVGLAIRLMMGNPILFVQPRPGLRGRLFELLKFRTMSAPPAGSAVDAVASDGARLTALGRFLRKTSLDELPQLWNVLKGDMSLVGPRPLLPEYLYLYNERQARRLEVRPGITGWAQVNGRNALSWEERFELDVWYVDHWSVWLDLKILALTVLSVLDRRGISQEGSATMEPFRGTPPCGEDHHDE